MFEHRDHLCLITELLQRNISDITHRNIFTELRLYTVQVLLRDLLLGVQAIHEAGYVHADLKPANMMWSAEDSNLKLFDFSLSFRQGQQINYQVQTRCYRSPEAHNHNLAVAKRQSRSQASWVSSAADGPPCSVKRVKLEPGPTDPEPDDAAADASSESKRPRRSTTPRELREAHQHPVTRSPLVDPGSPQRRAKPDQDQAARVPAVGNGECGHVATASAAGARERDGAAAAGESGACGGEAAEAEPLTNAIDLWSVGCIACELFTGQRLFSREQVPDVCPSCREIPNPNNGPSPAKELSCRHRALPDFHISSSIGPGNLGHARDQLAMLSDLKDLVASLLQCRPQRRPSARHALKHPFFKHRVLPSAAEMLSLPSSILRLVNIVDEDQLEADDEYQDALIDIQEECEKFGPIKICFLPREGTAKGKAFVHYTFSRHCQKALESLTGRAFNQHTILATYFPLHSWSTHQLF